MTTTNRAFAAVHACDSHAPGAAAGDTRAALPAAPPEEDYLLLSDVHLGSDLVQHLRPWAKEQWLQHKAEVDAPLVALLDHYAARTRPLALVFAGDFLDLVGVSISDGDGPLQTPLTPEEKLHGLGSAADHVVRKLQAIAARHHEVFAALARFVSKGHRLIVVRGNHDIELHWHAARRAFVQAVVQHTAAERRAELAARIQVCPWFFRVPGLLYVEHGHEFDPTCSYGDPLLPTCPRDSRRIRASAFSVLLRQVARPTRGLSSVNYGYTGMGAYVRLLGKLGLRGSVGIAGRYSRAALSLLREGLPAADRGQRRLRRAQAALKRFARTHGLSAEHLSRLRALYAAPITQSPVDVVRLLYLDRICAGAAALACVAAASASAGPASVVCAASAACFSAYAAIGAGTNEAPHESLQEGAREIANMFPTRWVVMGHTHAPVMQAVGEQTTYVNLGSWGEDDPPDERAATHVASRSFLLIEHTQAAPSASFLR